MEDEEVEESKDESSFSPDRINFGKKKSAIKIQKKDSAFMFLDFAKAHEALIERMIKENEHRVMLEALKR